MRNVLILGGRAPVALDHARRFAAHGWRVHVADSVSFNLAAYSRSVATATRVPAPRFQGAGFARALRELVTRERIELIVPTCEEVFFLSRHRGSLPAGVQV